MRRGTAELAPLARYYRATAVVLSIAVCFNPHPAFRPDATSRASPAHLSVAPVSILIRPFDRMLLLPPRLEPGAFSCFKSSSGLSTGCYFSRRRVPWSGFNPHPAFRPDATIKYAIKDT